MFAPPGQRGVGLHSSMCVRLYANNLRIASAASHSQPMPLPRAHGRTVQQCTAHSHHTRSLHTHTRICQHTSFAPTAWTCHARNAPTTQKGRIPHMVALTQQHLSHDDSHCLPPAHVIPWNIKTEQSLQVCPLPPLQVAWRRLQALHRRSVRGKTSINSLLIHAKLTATSSLVRCIYVQHACTCPPTHRMV